MIELKATWPDGKQCLVTMGPRTDVAQSNEDFALHAAEHVRNWLSEELIAHNRNEEHDVPDDAH